MPATHLSQTESSKCYTYLINLNLIIKVNNYSEKRDHNKFFFLAFTTSGTIMYTRMEIMMQIITAQSLQFLFLASLSNALEVFFILKAESLILFDLLSIS